MFSNIVASELDFILKKFEKDTNSRMKVTGVNKLYNHQLCKYEHESYLYIWKDYADFDFRRIDNIHPIHVTSFVEIAAIDQGDTYKLTVCKCNIDAEKECISAEGEILGTPYIWFRRDGTQVLPICTLHIESNV